MSYVQHLRCTGCSQTYPADRVMNLCPADNRPLEIVMDTERLRVEHANMGWYRPDISSMWRFGGLLPLDINHRRDSTFITSLGEGFTPLIPLPDFTLARRHEFRLFLKDEGQPHAGHGANPTASFKDRGMAMVVSMAARLGLKKLAVPTQGNAGDSLVEYALATGLQVVVVMPEDTPMPILGRVAALEKMHASVQLDLVSGTIVEAGARVKQKYVPEGYFNVATFQEPGWRIEGKKTLGLELAEPVNDTRNDWSLPDVVFYPTGGGTGILGMWKAFNELQAIGLIDSTRPRIIAVQSEQTAPVVNAFNNDISDTVMVEAGHTLATGLNVPGGIGHARVLEIIRESAGAAVSVSEASICNQLKSIYHSTGIWIGPEGAAAMAAIQPAIDLGLVQPGNDVVVFNTGSFEKYLPNIRQHLFAG